ncbi:hypothetical protein QYG06_07295 [Xanthomonas euvesicatoria]|uniref:Uncharacterized protein n=1 Tax=Xanthomonas euvesicatoria TaxID=456327 RepID=A0AAX4FQM7_XANEU|nr:MULTISPECIES: hypothetical protein [Xanthomonas]MBZ2513007.1 hypothetical protein [Xanthomonas perforans]MBZ2517554.1 hypothetical protein [Xanthomonas perforans]MBZ2519279.1 hypothetical protein [Xanthomonas perforans]MBZ2559262.1 hypothetical protein [Xanthomonas perforans]MBZ2588614.1 hypothetical protein [Xanthomonas perforans]
MLITCAILISPKRFFRQGGLAWSLRRGAIKLAVAAAEMNNGVASGTFSEIQYFLLSFCVGTKYVSVVYQRFGLFGSTPPIFSVGITLRKINTVRLRKRSRAGAKKAQVFCGKISG